MNRPLRIRPFLLLVFVALACNLPGAAGEPQGDGSTPAATPAGPGHPTPSEQVFVIPTATATPEPAPGSAPDSIFHNGRIVTMDPAQPEAQALAVAGDRIMAVGDAPRILALAGPETRVIDLDGRVVYPGFIDTHTHRISQRFKWGYESVEEAAYAALAQGWTTLDELAVGEAELAELLDAAARGALPVRVNAFLLVNTFTGEPLDDWFNAYRPGQFLGANLRAAGLKVFIDFDSGRTLFFSQDELNTLLLSPELDGWQIAIKAIGIQSHELALNAIETALGENSNALHRYRLEHSLAVTDEQLARMAGLGVIAAIQPSFPAVVWHEADIRLLTEEQGQENIFRWSDYLAAGVIMAASPYNPDGVNEELIAPSHVSPLGLLYRGAAQVGLGGAAPEPWMLAKAVGVSDILRMLTIDAAYAAFEEDVKGSLVPGKYADLVVLSGDPAAVPIDTLLDLQVLLTMVGGRAVFCAEGEEALCPTGGTAAEAAGVFVPAEGPLQIAAFGPLSGEFSEVFALLLAAYQMAVDDFGPIAGHPIAIVPLENPCSADAASSLTGPFLADPQIVAVLGPFCSNGAAAVLPELEAKGIVAVSPSATQPGLPALAPTVFNRVVFDDDQLAALGFPLAFLNDLPSFQSFYADFQSRTGYDLPAEGVRPYLAHAYDAAMLLLQALTQTASVQPDASVIVNRLDLAAAVRATASFEGVTGIITIDGSGNRVPTQTP